MNKRHLSAFRRSFALRAICLLILAAMFAPAAMAAASAAPVGLPAASGPHLGVAFLAAGLGGMMILRSPAGDEGDAGGGGGSQASEDKPVDAAEALAAVENKTLPMSERLSVAAKALRGIPPAEQFAKVKMDLHAADNTIILLKGTLEDKNKQITALQADVKQLEEANAKLEQTNKDLAAKEQDLTKRASEQARQIVRGIGIDATKLPAAQTGDEAPSVDALRSKLADASLSSEARGEIVKQIRQIQAQK